MKTSIYHITIKEQLDDHWAEWFFPLVIYTKYNGETTLRGLLRDQAELHGILTKVRDLNLTLLAVTIHNDEQEDGGQEDGGQEGDKDDPYVR